MAAGPAVGALSVRWDLTLWLLLVGFVGFSTAGFALHLFPAIARRPPPSPRGTFAAFLLAETAVVAGGAGLAFVGSGAPAHLLLLGGTSAFLLSEGTVVAVLLREFAQPRRTLPGPETRAGDAVTVPLFLASWSSALGASVLFVLSSLSEGPGLGWWLAAVHLFVLGHVVLLIVAVSLRLLPRALDADPARGSCTVVAGLGGAGAVAVPVGMLSVGPSNTRVLAYLGVPEAACVVLLLAVLLGLVVRARVRRAEVGLELVALGFLLGGGALGLAMAFGSEVGPVKAHALGNVLGFVGLTVLVEWFSMIAPFQRISHAWTRRMLWVLGTSWIVATLLLVASVGSSGPLSPAGAAAAGGAVCAVAVAWGAGTVPVLFPTVQPLPGLTSEEIRRLRERWKGR